jgi:hypothetical protein
MMPEWWYRLICRLRGHSLDVQHGAHDRRARRWSPRYEQTKTRCTKCGQT